MSPEQLASGQEGTGNIPTSLARHFNAHLNLILVILKRSQEFYLSSHERLGPGAPGLYAAT